jgi:hypothetical protein
MNSIETIVNYLTSHWWYLVIPAGWAIWSTVSRDIDKELSEKTCAYCLAKIDKRASHCRYCGKEQPDAA